MANSRKSGHCYEYATVDTAPGAAGYYTNEISPSRKIKQLFFSVRCTDKEDSSAAADSAHAEAQVTLQYKCIGDVDWTNYYRAAGVFHVGERIVLDAYGGGVHWRAGIRDEDYDTGSITFGFDW
jgi:hypothetical protein